MSKPFKTAICIVDDPNKIRLLADFTRAEILQLLCEHPMTESQLSKEFGLTKAAIGYHLNLLMKSQLIYLERVEPEEHGILQKFRYVESKTYLGTRESSADYGKE